MRIRTMLRDRLQGVPGLVVHNLAVGLDIGGVWRMSAQLSGIGPTLLPCSMRIGHSLPDQSAGTIDEALAVFLHTQRRRLADVLALDVGDVSGGKEDARHMLIDGPLMRYETGASSIVTKALRDGGRRLVEIELSTYDPAQPFPLAPGVMVSPGTVEDPRPRITLVCATVWGGYDGACLTVASGPMPEIIVAGMAGRRIDEILSLSEPPHEALEAVLNRTVLAARPFIASRVNDARQVVEVQHLALDVEPCWEPLR